MLTIRVESKFRFQRIQRQLGLFVGERLILCKDLPQYDFIIPLLRPISCVNDTKTFLYPSVGEYFHFSAVWSVHHNAFLVTELLPYQVLRAHTTTTSGNVRNFEILYTNSTISISAARSCEYIRQNEWIFQ